MTLPVPTNLPRIFLQVGYVGYPDNAWLDVATGDITPAPQRPTDEAAFPEALAMPDAASGLDGMAAAGLRQADPVVNKYHFLSTYNSSSGVPNNLIVPGDVISQDLLDDINASLPEQRKVPLYHPQYLDPDLELNTILDEQADVWITFVHEGAGYQNLLGFYTYPKGSPPATIDDIDEFTVVFPNASLQGSGGGLRSGDKVLLGSFPADTVIGFFLIPNGWRANMTLLGTYVAYYSDTHLNPEADPDLRQHAILLWDEQRQLALLGFEDLNRATSGCDNDFNDAMFYITANPPTAISSSSVAEIDTPDDGDSDGVSDLFDDYPADPSRAFRNHYPADGATMTVAYEDNWPELGDYDFNDLVLRCHFEYATNPQAQMVDLTGEFTILAIGAGYYNGFGFQMPFAPAAVASVSGHQVGAGYITLNPNGTEQGQAKAVVVVSDNVFDVIPKPAEGMVNTRAEDAYVEPQTLTVTIALNAPLATATNGPALFNHFMIGHQDRGVEIHAPGYPPTDLADPDLFGTEDDDTAPASGRYYVSAQTMPWALILPTDWSYPWEKTRLTHAYNRFGAWAESSGSLYADWYATPPIFGEVYVPPAD
jgi:LruC domain-containing protein